VNGNARLRALIWILVLGALFVKAGAGTYRCHPLDTFEEGHSLGPAIDYMDGKVPYKDTIFIHGPFRDPLRSVLAFKIHGKSIAAVRTLDSFMSILALALFFVASYLLCSGNISYDQIPLLTFLIVAVLIQGVVIGDGCSRDKVKMSVLLFLFTFVPTSTFAISIDKAFFLCTAATLYSLAIYLLYLRRVEPRYIFPILSGYIVGIGVLGFAIRWAYCDFVKFIMVLVRLDPILNGLVYPFRQLEFLVPVLFISVILYWLIYRFVCFSAVRTGSFLEKVRLFYVDYFMEALLLMLSIVYFRRVLGRSDLQHLAGVVPLILILTAYILIKHYLSPFLNRTKDGKRITVAAAIMTLALFALTFPAKMNWQRWYKLPLGIPDKAFIPENYHETISFLKRNMGTDDAFLTLTSEASWYYFVDKPCPIRFSVIYHAMPCFYQKEIIEDLRDSNVKFVLYRNSHWANTIESFDVEARLPIVMEYIRQNYVFFKMIDDNEIWIRKGLDADGNQNHVAGQVPAQFRSRLGGSLSELAELQRLMAVC
jgi:hypothetical protein